MARSLGLHQRPNTLAQTKPSSRFSACNSAADHTYRYAGQNQTELSSRNCRASHLESNMIVKRVLALAENHETYGEHREGDGGQLH